MAREFIEYLYFNGMEGASSYSGQMSNDMVSEDVGADMFDVFKRKVEQYKNLLSGFAGLPELFKRKASTNTPEEDQGSAKLLFENIEMDRFGSGEIITKGHDFTLKQLTNPTWCDECGDFIWGLYKQCLRCKYCQFTCHQKCGPLVRLGCKCKSPTDGAAEGTDPLSAETSLSDFDSSSTLSPDGSSEPTNEKDETDSGYRSGTIPDEKLPKKPSQATLNREELGRKIEEYNTLVPGADLCLKEEKGESFQGFIKVVLNLVRPICMSLGIRPPSIYQALTREHIIEQNTQTVSFYMPRDTTKCIHVHSETSTKEVIAMLLQKFHILDNPRKFALYEQQLNSKGKITKLRRLNDKEAPLSVCLEWENEKIPHSRLVIQENETGEIMWEAFSAPELNNFLRVLDREEGELISQLEYKYKVMKKIIHQRMKELRREKHKEQVAKRESLHEQKYSPEHRKSTADSAVN